MTDSVDIAQKFQQLSKLYDQRTQENSRQRRDDLDYIDELRRKIDRWIKDAKKQIDQYGQKKNLVLDEFYDSYVDEIRQRFLPLRQASNQADPQAHFEEQMDAFNTFIQANQLRKRLQIEDGNVQFNIDQDIPIKICPYSDDLVDQREIRPLKAPPRDETRLSHRATTFSVGDEQRVNRSSVRTNEHFDRDGISTTERSTRTSYRTALSVDSEAVRTSDRSARETLRARDSPSPRFSRRTSPRPDLYAPTESFEEPSSQTNRTINEEGLQTSQRSDVDGFSTIDHSRKDSVRHPPRSDADRRQQQDFSPSPPCGDLEATESIRYRDRKLSESTQRSERRSQRDSVRRSPSPDGQRRQRQNSSPSPPGTHGELSVPIRYRDRKLSESTQRSDRRSQRDSVRRSPSPDGQRRQRQNSSPSPPGGELELPESIRYRNREPSESTQRSDRRSQRDSVRDFSYGKRISRQSMNIDEATDSFDGAEAKCRMSMKNELSPIKSVKFFSTPNERKFRILVDTNRQLTIEQEKITEYVIDSVHLSRLNDDGRERSRLISTDTSQGEPETDENLIVEYKNLIVEQNDDEQDSVFLPDQDENQRYSNLLRLNDFDHENFSTIMLKRFATEFNCFGSSTRRNELVIVNVKLQLIAILQHEKDRHCQNRLYFDWPAELDIRDVSDISYCQRSDQYLFSTLRESQIYAFNRDVQTLTKICHWNEKLPLRRLHCYEDTLYCIIGNHYLLKYVFDPFKFSLFDPQQIALTNSQNSRTENPKHLLDVTCDDQYLLVAFVTDRDVIHLRLIDRFSNISIGEIKIDGPHPIAQNSIRLERGLTKGTFVYLNGFQRHLKSIVVDENEQMIVTSTINRKFQPSNLNFLKDGRLVVLHENPHHFLSIHPQLHRHE